MIHNRRDFIPKRRGLDSGKGNTSEELTDEEKLRRSRALAARLEALGFQRNPELAKHVKIRIP